MANFSTFPALFHSTAAYDEDLQEIIEASQREEREKCKRRKCCMQALAEGGCEELWLGAAEISPTGALT